MNSRYSSSPTNLRALRDRLTATAKRQDVIFGRLQQHVGVLVIAQFFSAVRDDRGGPVLLIKGGASLELRRGISESRTSKDLDTVIRGDVNVFHDQLADAGASGWEGFTALFTPPVAFEVPALAVNPYRFTAKLSYYGKPFVSVPIEVSPVEAGNADAYDEVGSQALTLVGLPASDAVPCMTVPWQIAQKIHACTEPMEPPRTNDRAHDLVDLQLLEALVATDALASIREACVAVFAARTAHAWPPTATARQHWGPIYTRALEGLEFLDVAADVDAAIAQVQRFIDRIDAAD